MRVYLLGLIVFLDVVMVFLNLWPSSIHDAWAMFFIASVFLFDYWASRIESAIKNKTKGDNSE